MKEYNKVKWNMWILLSFSMLIAMFLRLSTSVISDNLQNELGFTSLEISNIATLTLYSYAFIQIPLGLMIDKYGPRKITSVGMIVAGLGTILFGSMNNIYLAYLSRIMIGSGTAGVLLSIMKIQVNWFEESEFTDLTSKISLIASIGGLFATFPLVMLNNVLGWRNSFLFIGMISIMQGTLIFLKLKDTPKEYGYNIEKSIKIEDISIKDGLKSVMKNSSTYFNSLIMFSLVGITTSFSSLWIVPYITDVYLVEKSVSAFIASFLTYGMVFGAIVMNKIFNKIQNNRLNVIKYCGVINIFIWSFIIINDAKPPIFILPILFFIIGILNMSHVEAFNDVKKNNEEKYSGLSTSVINTTEFIGSGFINLFIGSVMTYNLDVNIEYKIGFLLFIVFNLIAVISASLGVRKEKIKENVI